MKVETYKHTTSSVAANFKYRPNMLKPILISHTLWLRSVLKKSLRNMYSCHELCAISLWQTGDAYSLYFST